MKSTNRLAWLLSTLFVIGLFCTIQDDNGELVMSGPNTPNIPNIIEPGKTPALFASPESAYVRVRDTLAIWIRAFADSSNIDAAPPLAGARITLLANRGWLSGDTVVTDSNGRARILFSDTVAGRIEIGIRAPLGVTQTVRFEVTNTPDKIQKLIKAVPQRSIIKADGRDFTYISVVVMNRDHNPIVGEVVQFVSTSGLISGENPPAGFSGRSITDKDGTARAKLVSANVNDTAYITAFLVSDRSMNDEAKVAFQGVSIKLEATSVNLKPGDETIVRAQVLNASGEPIVYAPVFFRLGKDRASNLKVVSFDSLTGLDGVARIIVRGTSTGSDSLSVVSAGASGATWLNVTDLRLTTSLSAQVLQAKISESSVLKCEFSRNDGTKLSAKQIKVVRTYKTPDGTDTSDTIHAITDAAGVSEITIHALPYEGVMQLAVTAYNRADDIASATISIEFMTTRTITIAALPTLIQADGTSTSQISVQVKTEDNNPIVGDEIRFSSDAGMITGAGKTDANGKAFAKLTSDRRNIVATVTATYEDKFQKKQVSIKIEFSGVKLKAVADPRSIRASKRDTCTITVSLVDAAGNKIVGERVNYTQKYRPENCPGTIQNPQLCVQIRSGFSYIVAADSVTDNRGEARCKVVGDVGGTDTILVKAAGDSARVPIFYSRNILIVDTVSWQSAIANGTDSTRIRIRFLQPDSVTPISTAQLDVNVTVGHISSTAYFAQTLALTAADQGVKYFYIKNPDFPDTATIQVSARVDTLLTAAKFQLYFKADRIAKIKLSGTPEVIAANGDRAKITAIAIDNRGNRVSNAIISFNLLSGPGGGEYLDPPTATTAADGSASTFLISGTLASTFRQVWIAAGDFGGLKSDTIKFTIAGPPHHITIRRNIGEIVKSGATYRKKCVAIVTDINNNPVADGTEVTFSLQVTSYRIFRISYDFVPTASYYAPWIVAYDTIPIELPFEDLNNNFRLDSGEDINRDGLLNRGEDYNGEDGDFNPGPPFEDINWNGIRDIKPESVRYFTRYDSANTPIKDSVMADLNGNGHIDPIEPLLNPSYLSAYRAHLWGMATTADYAEMARQDSAYWAGLKAAGGQFDYDWNLNGVPDPQTAITITRTVQTVNGLADNDITYGQSDARRIQVKVWAESQGKTTASPDQFWLPLAEEDLRYWGYRE